MKKILQSMDLLESLEIYIPVEAEVKKVPLSSLPNSVLRRMNLPLSDNEGSRKLAEAPEGIWICPAVLRRKGQKVASRSNGAIENMSSLMGREFRAATGPFRMSFVSSNHAAYKVLKDTMPGEKVSTRASHVPPLLPGPAQQTYQDAVVIYRGRIYLSIRKPNRSRQKTRGPQPASQSSIPSTSDVASKRQKHQSPQASLELADKEQQRKRLQITLPKIPPKRLKNLLPDIHSTTDLLNEDRPKKNPTCKVTHSKNRKDVAHKGRDVSSSKPARRVRQPTDSVHKPLGEKEEVVDGEKPDMGGEEAESTDQNNDMDSTIKIDSGEPDNIVGIVEQSSSQSWTRRESPSAAGASTPLQQDFDFKELAQEEKIARMKAKLRRSEAALNNLHSS